jgi:hypothetical protein
LRPVREDEHCVNGSDLFLDLSRNSFLVELVLLNTTGVGEPGRV